MPERNLFLNFHIDTNRINSKAQLRHMNILEQWHERDAIYIEMSEIAQKEAVKTADADRREKAYTYGATETLAETPEEAGKLREIENILFPQGIKSRNQWNDVEIVFNAYKYGAILVTDDGGSKRQPNGILGNAKRLRQIGIEVLRDHEAVELVRQKIIERDQLVREVASITGEPLPDWLGKDLDVGWIYDQ